MLRINNQLVIFKIYCSSFVYQWKKSTHTHSSYDVAFFLFAFLCSSILSVLRVWLFPYSQISIFFSLPFYSVIVSFSHRNPFRINLSLCIGRGIISWCSFNRFWYGKENIFRSDSDSGAKKFVIFLGLTRATRKQYAWAWVCGVRGCVAVFSLTLMNVPGQIYRRTIVTKYERVNA